MPTKPRKTATAKASAAESTPPADANSLDAPPDTPADSAELDASRLTHLVGYAASRAAIELRKTFARHMDPLRVKVVEFSILMLVAQNEQVNQKRLGQALDVSPPNMAVILDRMVEQGWVERVRGTRDRRAQHIHLTPKGNELVQRAGKIATTMEDSSLHMLSTAERALLIELLMKVARGAPGH